MDSSDFLSAFMSALPSETFSDRSAFDVNVPLPPAETNRISRFSRLECLRMHSVYDSAASARTSLLTVRAILPSPCQDKIGTRKL